ncbi:Na+/H+ antiporter [Dactylosporangium sucinum]|uniref:Na(+)/H(+) exchanger n=1 Tax=Dactylosporangium sucinum TaxID=1424081 RepID=A0A917U3F1_9ACTN|nr:Na+/H+ antiporter [Dactylosporangium sucinum]GGM55426.1 putative Na(+)/H(+) exchanger [Dactylosporangium sucinum]
MEALFLVIVLGVTVLVGTTVGRRYSVAPPVLLILFGGLLALLPPLAEVELPPDAVLGLFLPAVLYWESLNTSLREIRANLRVIVLSAVVLVIATMAAVSYALQAVGVTAAAAWILGAVLAPTDASAVSGLAKRMPRRTLTTLRAESLVNDGTALVLFAVAVGTLGGAAMPGPLELTWRLAWSSVGGVLAGLVTAGAVILVRRRLDDPRREGGLSILTPFAAFLLAELLHASGVVAVVVGGLVLTQASPRVVRARSRVQAFAFWDLGTFMLNGSLFVLVGMQIPRAVRAIEHSAARALGIAALAAVTVIVVRLLWVHVMTGVIRAVDRRAVQRARRVGWKARTANGWAGFRGAVSLAAALAVPTALPDGTPYADRSLIVFTTVVVIVVTMLVQGLTLPMVIRWAGLTADDGRAGEALQAQIEAARAGLSALDDVARELGAPRDMVDRLRAEYEDHLQDVRARTHKDGEAYRMQHLERRLRLRVLTRKRQAVTAMRDANTIDDIVLRDLQAAMDIEEMRLLGPAPSE